jgi:hypothetical protein
MPNLAIQSLNLGDSQEVIIDKVNSNFDVIFQKILKKKENKIKYISLNSTKVFTNNLDDYAVSKRLLHKNFICSKYFKSIYIDLIFDRNSQHFIKIQRINFSYN